MSDRARQFMPFDALKGHKEAIERQRRIVVEKHELNEDDIPRLTYIMQNIKRGMKVKVIHYDYDAYIETEGLVSEINLECRYITIVKQRIYFDDINDISTNDIKDYDSFYNL